MNITASNGRDYDLENLSDSDRAELIQLKHLPKPVAEDLASTTPSVLALVVDEIVEASQEGVDALKPKKNESKRL